MQHNWQHNLCKCKKNVSNWKSTPWDDCSSHHSQTSTAAKSGALSCRLMHSCSAMDRHMQHAVFHTIAFLAFSCLAFSTLAFWCRIFMSRNFMSRIFSVPARWLEKSQNMIDVPTWTAASVGPSFFCPFLQSLLTSFFRTFRPGTNSPKMVPKQRKDLDLQIVKKIP